MTLEQNIKAILECNFVIAKDEVIEAATKRIMEQISSQRSEVLQKCYGTDIQYAIGYQMGHHYGLCDAIDAIEAIKDDKVESEE